jgi:LysR family hydrogen peroxide-inducible transcriptional activator
LLLDDGHCFRDQALAICAEAEASELEFRATSLTTLTQMVAAGSGVTLLPRLAVPTETQRTRLAIRVFEEPAPERTIALVWRRRSPLASAFQQMVGTIQKAYPRSEARPPRSTKAGAKATRRKRRESSD